MAGNKGIVSAQYYTFNAANQTITFSNDYAGLNLGEITYITNIKNGVATVIYDPFDPTKGGTLSGLTLTLAYNTTAMADSDPLQIITGFTPLEADPLPVRIVEGPDQKDDTELLNRIADGVDFLNLSLNQTEGIEVNVREKNPAKRDINNAQIPSDGITFTKTLRTTSDVLLIETTGYNSVEVWITGEASITSAQLTAASSFDGISWLISPGTSNSNTTVSSVSSIAVSPGASSRVIFPAIGKFIRFTLTSIGGGGGVSIIAVLRQTPLPTGPFTQIPVSATANIALYNSTAVATAQQVDAAGNLASAGNFAIGSSYVGTTNRPNAASSLATGVPYPISIGGREQPYIGALAGVFRHITVDGGGRYILGGDTPDTETRFQSRRGDGSIPGIPPRGVGARSNNMVGAQSLTVVDTNQDFGDTQVMLLRQILTELKILNQQFAEMPQILNQANFTMSDPQEYRNDGDFDSSIQ